MARRRWTFIIAAICGVTGILITYFFVPDMTGVDLADEDAAFLQYLTDNGWEGEVGEDDDRALVVKSIGTRDSVEIDSEKGTACKLDVSFETRSSQGP